MPARHLVIALVLPLLLLATGCGAEKRAGASKPPSTPLDRALHDALPADVRERGVLVVATDASYAPASSFAADGRTIVGFEPDLGAALGRVLGIELRFTQRKFSGLLADIADGRADLVMSAMTDTRQRQRGVDFINYFSAGTAILVQRGNPIGITDLARLCGQTVAVEDGTTQVDLLQRSQKHCDKQPIVIKSYDTNADALVQLRTGRAAAVLTDYPPAAQLASDPATGARFQLASTSQYEPGLYGIGVAKSRPELRDSGEYRRILARWDVGDGALKASSVNGGAIG